MLYPTKNKEELEKLEELASLQSQLKAVKVQGKLGKQNFPEDVKKYLNQSINHLKIPLKI